jgi:hypothetical protein
MACEPKAGALRSSWPLGEGSGCWSGPSGECSGGGSGGGYSRTMVMVDSAAVDAGRRSVVAVCGRGSQRGLFLGAGRMRQRRLCDAPSSCQYHGKSGGVVGAAAQLLDAFTKTGLCLCLCEVVAGLSHMTCLGNRGQDCGHRTLRLGTSRSPGRWEGSSTGRSARGTGVLQRGSRAGFTASGGEVCTAGSSQR